MFKNFVALLLIAGVTGFSLDAEYPSIDLPEHVEVCSTYWRDNFKRKNMLYNHPIVYNFCTDSHLMYSLIACSQKCDTEECMNECLEKPLEHYNKVWKLRCYALDL